MDETRQGGDEQLAFKDSEADISDTTAPTHKSNSISPDFLSLPSNVLLFSKYKTEKICFLFHIRSFMGTQELKHL